MKKTLIIGGGAAGMMAAIFAARGGDEVCLFEKNEKLGKKLYITGKGRCNFTTADGMEELMDSIVSNRKFMFSSLYEFQNYEVMDFFDQLGVPYKIERGNRVFPQSDRAADVIDGLYRAMKKEKVKIMFNTSVEKISTSDGKVNGLTADGKFYPGDKVIVATGGLSYPVTGSSGDGLKFAREAGHKVTECYPSLVPMNVSEDYVKELQGLSLRNIHFSIEQDNKVIYEEFGELMFTHFGITGPVVLSASAYVGPKIRKNKVQGFINLKPALTKEQLDARLLREFEQARTKQFKNVIGHLYPSSLTPIIIKLSGISPEKKTNEIRKDERQRIIELTTRFPFTITGLRDYKEAIITKGGIDVKQINPKNMESKLVKGLFFAGEVLDIDALTGGYNLQLAWSTAHAAAKQEEKT